MNFNNKDYEVGTCRKCSKTVLRSEIEKSFKSGTITKNPLTEPAGLPEIHKRCDGVVDLFPKEKLEANLKNARNNN